MALRIPEENYLGFIARNFTALSFEPKAVPGDVRPVRFPSILSRHAVENTRRSRGKRRAGSDSARRERMIFIAKSPARVFFFHARRYRVTPVREANGYFGSLKATCDGHCCSSRCYFAITTTTWTSPRYGAARRDGGRYKNNC